MDQTPKPQDETPIALPLKPATPKKPKPRWLKILLWTIAAVGAAAIAYGAYIVFSIVIGVSTIASKCQSSQQKAATASQTYADELNSLNLYSEPYTKAQPSPSGDCIDTADHTADATMEKLYSTPVPLDNLNQTVTSQLASKGFKLTTGLTLQPINDPTDPITATTVYSKSGFPDLTMTYYIGHNTTVCSNDDMNSDIYNTCVTQYEDSFKDLTKQTATEADAEMTQSFSNNY